jgi:hypothetical protein
MPIKLTMANRIAVEEYDEKVRRSKTAAILTIAYD